MFERISQRVGAWLSDRRIAAAERDLQELRSARARIAADTQRRHLEAEKALVLMQKRITRDAQLEAARLDYLIVLAGQTVDDYLDAAPRVAPVVPITTNKAA